MSYAHILFFPSMMRMARSLSLFLHISILINHRKNKNIKTAAKLDLFPSGVVPKTINDNVHQRRNSVESESDESIINSTKSHHHKWKQFFNKQSTKLCLCFLGIFIAYLAFGIIQESM
jgi:hypothetical protein